MRTWSEYTANLFKDDRGERLIVRRNKDGPQVMKSEIRAAMKEIK